MRIQVQFGETQVLVPCGDGKITVSELVEKAIVRYRKVTNRVSVLKVRSYLVNFSESAVCVCVCACMWRAIGLNRVEISTTTAHTLGGLP